MSLAAPVQRGVAATNSGVTTLAVTLSTAIPAGETAYIQAGFHYTSNPTIVSATDNGPGLTWGKDLEVNGAAGGTNLSMAGFSVYCPDGIASGKIVTITFPESGKLRIASVGSFPGRGALHKIKTQAPVAAALTWSTGDTAATTVAGTLAIGYMMTAAAAANNNQAGSTPGTFLEVAESSDGLSNFVTTEAHDIASGTAVRAAGTVASSVIIMSMVAVYQEVVSTRFMAAAG